MAKISADEGQATAASFICAAFPGRNSHSGRGQLVSPAAERWTLNLRLWQVAKFMRMFVPHFWTFRNDVGDIGTARAKVAMRLCERQPIPSSPPPGSHKLQAIASAALRFHSQLQFRVASVSHPMLDTTHRYVSNIRVTLAKKCLANSNDAITYHQKLILGQARIL